MSASNPYVGYDKDVRGVGNLWERFQAGLVSPEEASSPYYRMLLQEWRRCTALGVDLAMTMARRLSDDEVQERLRASQLMLETYLPLIESLNPFLDGHSSMMMLTDASGCILHMAGTEQALDQAAAHSGIVIGSRWEESQAGNNGMGSVLAKRQPVHVFATEHFCEGLQRWSCSAAPVFDVDGQTIIGTINFTTEESTFKGDALMLPVSLAHSLRGRLALQREQDRNRLLAIFEEESRRSPHEKMLVVDHAGRPISHSQTEAGHAIAARWWAGERGHERVSRSTDITSPVTGENIGKILRFSPLKPQGYERIFQSGLADSAQHTPRMMRFGQFLSCDPETINTLETLERIARADVNVLLHGETGTGKELIARHIHVASRRRDAPYLAINCGAISSELLESTFFGYVRGAFSGADPKGRAGYFESVGEGTLFLDEIGELPLAMQAALLRVLEDGSFLRVGSSTPQRASCRIIAATHRNLEELIAQGQFRQDLYYRLKIVQKRLKPIRERTCDIALLAEQFKSALAQKHQIPNVQIHPEAMAVMERYQWPGNAREIRNVMEAALICSDGEITLASLPPEVSESPTDPLQSREPEANSEMPPDTGNDYERQLIVGLLRKYRKVNHVARALGLARSTLYRKFADLGIDQREYVNDLSD
ncbi:sigma-54-dependent Fis family transcriptional regulator [Comamonas sp. Tr-654]|uniref:sigma-54-dependent Fis family transcriptional regulator n=1 Tax=Comamonas sp. Tr-654 TaxID=2608341 RepID=UPI00141E67AC|nr:sigma-54-dependent Fis family transcriptional regulator [Comamonas sp. Tr-654]NIF85820.1 sigma-54-dependent Fis family transcriptional regulator [Comamonas sp. Tr-654]